MASSCQKKSILLNYENIEQIKKYIDYEYYQLIYSDKIDEEHLFSVTFFDSNNLKIEHLYGETRCQLKYDIDDNLIEKYHCRFNNCGIGLLRELMIYNDENNLIGSYFTSDEIIDLDTIKIKQTKFYNVKNKIIRELYRNGDDWETWKNFSYTDDKIEQITQVRNNDTLSVSKYIYDDIGNLIEIKTNIDYKIIIEKYEYDSKGRIIRYYTLNNDKNRGLNRLYKYEKN